MRNQGIETKDWSIPRQSISIRLFIEDLRRDYERFLSESMVAWHLSPNKTKESAASFNEAIDDYRNSTFYNNLMNKSNKKKSKEESDKEILNRVANLSEDINEL